MAEDRTTQIMVDFPSNLKGGAYTNNMVVVHTKEEFVMDFMMVVPPVGAVTARVITSPGHMKRMLKALQENVSKYETQFGKLEASEAPSGRIGFSAQ